MLRIFSAGSSWERAFNEAIRFLDETGGTLLLGPKIGEDAKAWITDRYLSVPVRLGARIQPWKEWVKARARAHALGQGRDFRPLNPAAEREYFRVVVKSLAESGAFHHLQKIWDEERFFSALLDCVGEARRAGLHDQASILRAREQLANGADPVQRAAYDDFWRLLALYEGLLAGKENRLDEAAVIRFATESDVPTPALFLLGFDELSLLEVELVQKLAGSAEVCVPIALPGPRFRAIQKGADQDLDLPAALTLRGLLTGFAGEVILPDAEAPSPSPSRTRFLAAHAPSEEARAAAALGRASLSSGGEVRFVAPPGYFEDISSVGAFREELGLPRNFQPRRLLSHPVARLFFHALALKDEGFRLAHGLELAQLLAFTRDEFTDVPSRAARAGVRAGLADWKRKGRGDPVLERFAASLEEIDRILPEKGLAADFAAAAEGLAAWVGIGELARRAPDHELEREAHAALAAVLRNARMLAASTRTEFTFREWMRELSALLGRGLAGEVLSVFPSVQFYRYGDWLPPAGEGTLTVALGLGADAGPRRTFHFYLEERARRKLGDFLLPTQVQADLGFLDSLRRIASGGRALFSWSKHDGAGKECEPNWAAGSLDLQRGEWPEAAPARTVPDFRAEREVRVPSPGLAVFSPSLLEAYRECPFKAFAENLLRLEDQVQEASLDVSRLDEGSIVHKALELYYGKHGGKSVSDPAERARLLDVCLAAAGEEQRVEYFRGNDELYAIQLARLRRKLLNFLALDADNYARFPFLGTPAVERVVGGRLNEKFSWEGKIDRIDLDEEAKRLIVVDYKLGASTPTNKEVLEVRRFQLQLYQDGAEAAFPGYEAVGGIYASLETGKRDQGLVRKDCNHSGKKGEDGGRKYFGLGARSTALLEPEAFRELRERSKAEALRIAESVDRGEFPVSPTDEEKSCARCSVRPACRVRELSAPPRERWERLDPTRFRELLEAPASSAVEPPGEKRFNPEQRDALARRGELVFIEASAGTGKTTVIVERIRRFLEERPPGEPVHLALERFAAISFTEKSAQELGARVAATLLQDPAFGARVAAQAQQQIGTIHGFCRRILADFPVEAGISPLAATLDPKATDALKAEVMEEFFLNPPEAVRERFGRALAEFPRAKVEGMLYRLLDGRALLEAEIAAFLAGAAGLYPAGAARELLADLLALTDALAEAYGAAKRSRNALDFNDLEGLALKVLESEEARAFYREKYSLVLVDEFQDTNAVQRAIFERVARPEWSNLFVVGDAKQSIYRFRAADVSVFQGLRKEAEAKGRLVTLARNYRSRQEIVAAANEVTSAIFPAPGATAPDFEAVDAPAIAEHQTGGRVALVEYGTAEEKLTAGERRDREARILARLVSEIRARPGKPKSIAVLLRKFAGNEAYLRALTTAGIPFRVGASRGFYGQSVITDSIALLRTLYGAKNDIALLAVLRSPWGRMSDGALLELQRRGSSRTPLWEKLEPTEAPRLFAWRKRASHLALSGLLQEAYAEYPMGRREHLQAVKLLGILEGMEREARPRMEILDRLSAWAGWDNESSAEDDAIMPEPAAAGSVQVMTVHAAKGLEFDVTILADLVGKMNADNSALRMVRGEGIVLKLESEDENELYKEIGKKNAARELAELKRLFYVAVTRAKEEEYFLRPRAHPSLPPEKWGCCADFLTAAKLSKVEKIDGDAWVQEAAPRVKIPANAFSPAGSWPAPPTHAPFRDTSITELAAYQFCGEFHRRKFVQGWDDQIVALWEKPKNAFRKFAGEGTKAKNAEEVSRCLRALGLERKERGIALHRVLERVHHPEFDLAHAALWLREAYEAQGAPVDRPELGELIAADEALLTKFLRSPIGLELFAPGVEAFPELPFEWRFGEMRIHGALDRLIRKPDGTWIVADYKSSLLEESRERYRFQVASYMTAVAAHARTLGEANPHVRGYLVSLHDSSAHPVEAEPVRAEADLLAEIQRARENYTLAVEKLSPAARGVRGGDQCFSCPYSLHCEIGREIVLEFR